MKFICYKIHSLNGDISDSPERKIYTHLSHFVQLTNKEGLGSNRPHVCLESRSRPWRSESSFSRSRPGYQDHVTVSLSLNLTCIHATLLFLFCLLPFPLIPSFFFYKSGARPVSHSFALFRLLISHHALPYPYKNKPSGRTSSNIN